MHKVGFVILVDSGTVFTSVDNFIQLKNLRKVKETPSEYADGSIGGEISTKGNFVLNGHRIPAIVSSDSRENLLSIPRVDRKLGGGTIQFEFRSIPFIHKQIQKEALRQTCNDVDEESLIIEANLSRMVCMRRIQLTYQKLISLCSPKFNVYL